MKTTGLLMAATAAALALGAGSASATAVNLLNNGSFELFSQGSGYLTDWTPTYHENSGAGASPPVVIQYGQSSDYPTGDYGKPVPADNASANPGLDPVGSHGLLFSSDQANPETISQGVMLQAGVTYTFGFDVYEPANGAANPYGAAFTADLAGWQFASYDASAVPVGQWMLISAQKTFTATQAGLFNFSFTADGNPAKDFVIDRLYLAETDTLPGGVPEPASWALMIVGFGGAGMALRSRRRQAATA